MANVDPQSVGMDPTGAWEASRAQAEMAAANPFGRSWTDDFMGSAGGVNPSGVQPGDPTPWNPLLKDYDARSFESLRRAQYEQAPLTHSLFGFGRPSHYKDWQMRQQDEITRQHFANIDERNNVLGRMWETNPYSAVINQQLENLGQVQGQWDQILGGAESRMGRESQNQLEDAAAQSAARGMQMTPTDVAMMEQSAAAAQAGAMGQLQQQASQARTAAATAGLEGAGRAGQLEQMQNQAIAQYSLGTLPEAESLELMGATPSADWGKGERQMVGSPWSVFEYYGGPKRSLGNYMGAYGPLQGGGYPPGLFDPGRRGQPLGAVR